MQAIVYKDPGGVRVLERPLPALEHPGDALVRVTTAGLCGSDLHIVDGRDRGCRAGTIMGHELVGVVDRVGAAVTRFRPGDRVVSPFSVSCGACFYCRRSLPARCVAAACFGFVNEDGRGLEGAQAEGRGADVVLEAVGAGPALDLAIALVRPGGTVSIAGYHTDEVYPLGIQAAYGKNLTLKIGRCNARYHMERLMPLVAARALRHTEIITHEMPLSAGEEAYAMFRERRDGAIKVLLDPRR